MSYLTYFKITTLCRETIWGRSCKIQRTDRGAIPKIKTIPGFHRRGHYRWTNVSIGKLCGGHRCRRRRRRRRWSNISRVLSRISSLVMPHTYCVSISRTSGMRLFSLRNGSHTSCIERFTVVVRSFELSRTHKQMIERYTYGGYIRMIYRLIRNTALPSSSFHRYPNLIVNALLCVASLFLMFYLLLFC